MDLAVRFERILGVRFVVENVPAAVDSVCRDGGLVVMPSAPALMLLTSEDAYRDAILGADLALPDSALMVLIWNLTHRLSIPKLSGLKYLRSLIKRPEFRVAGSSLWVMPDADSARRNAAWLRENHIALGDEDVYLAPIYDPAVRDLELLSLIEERRPRHVILCLAGGVQERLGLYLKKNLDFRPAIHCIGAAIAFLSGAQIRIPVWVDRAGLGWLWRSMSNPMTYLPRYWMARRLIPMMLRFQGDLPSVINRPASLRSAFPAKR